jgi:1,4-dihydroxy-2-naphthoate octaprenyltransferase
VILGRSRTITEYKLLLLLSYGIPPVMLLIDIAGTLILLPLVTLPQAWQLAKKITLEKGVLLNELLAGTARLSLVYSLLFAAGLAFGTNWWS